MMAPNAAGAGDKFPSRWASKVQVSSLRFVRLGNGREFGIWYLHERANQTI